MTRIVGEAVLPVKAFRALFRPFGQQDIAHDLAGAVSILVDLLEHLLLARGVLLDPRHIGQDLPPCLQDLLLIGQTVSRFRLGRQGGLGRGGWLAARSRSDAVPPLPLPLPFSVPPGLVWNLLFRSSSSRSTDGCGGLIEVLWAMAMGDGPRVRMG